MIRILKQLIVLFFRKMGYEIHKLPPVTLLSFDGHPRSLQLGFPHIVEILKKMGGYQDRIALRKLLSIERGNGAIRFNFPEENVKAIKEILIENKILALGGSEKAVFRTTDLMHERIHYGSGKKFFQDWLNVDLFESDEPSYMRVNLLDTHPFRDESFRFGYSEDLLEHFNQGDSFIFLSEAFRTLRVNGVLRLSFPGLEGVLKMHYEPWCATTAFTGKIDAYLTWEHLHFYSFEEIKLVAEAIGFRKVKRVECGISDHKELAGLDTRVAQADLNCHVELQK